MLESEQFKGKRKEEDLLAYKRKLDRHKKDNPLSTTIDEVFKNVYPLSINLHISFFMKLEHLVFYYWCAAYKSERETELRRTHVSFL